MVRRPVDEAWRGIFEEGNGSDHGDP